VIADAKSVIRLPQLTGALRSVSDSATVSVGHHRTTLDSCGPGAWTTPGKLFTPALPAVDKYKPEYYRLHTSSSS
jgi:hypothetical protein